MADDSKMLQDSFASLAKEIENVSRSFKDLGPGLSQLKGIVIDYGKSTDLASESVKKHTDELKKNTKEVESNSEKVKTFSERLLDLSKTSTNVAAGFGALSAAAAVPMKMMEGINNVFANSFKITSQYDQQVYKTANSLRMFSSSFGDLSKSQDSYQRSLINISSKTQLTQQQSEKMLSTMMRGYKGIRNADVIKQYEGMAIAIQNVSGSAEEGMARMQAMMAPMQKYKEYENLAKQATAGKEMSASDIMMMATSGNVSSKEMSDLFETQDLVQRKGVGGIDKKNNSDVAIKEYKSQQKMGQAYFDVANETSNNKTAQLTKDASALAGEQISKYKEVTGATTVFGGALGMASAALGIFAGGAKVLGAGAGKGGDGTANTANSAARIAKDALDGLKTGGVTGAISAGIGSATGVSGTPVHVTNWSQIAGNKGGDAASTAKEVKQKVSEVQDSVKEVKEKFSMFKNMLSGSKGMFGKMLAGSQGLLKGVPMFGKMLGGMGGASSAAVVGGSVLAAGAVGWKTGKSLYEGNMSNGYDKFAKFTGLDKIGMASVHGNREEAVRRAEEDKKKYGGGPTREELIQGAISRGSSQEEAEKKINDYEKKRRDEDEKRAMASQIKPVEAPGPISAKSIGLGYQTSMEELDKKFAASKELVNSTADAMGSLSGVLSGIQGYGAQAASAMVQQAEAMRKQGEIAKEFAGPALKAAEEAQKLANSLTDPVKKMEAQDAANIAMARSLKYTTEATTKGVQSEQTLLKARTQVIDQDVQMQGYSTELSQAKKELNSEIRMGIGQSYADTAAIIKNLAAEANLLKQRAITLKTIAQERRDRGDLDGARAADAEAIQAETKSIQKTKQVYSEAKAMREGYLEAFREEMSATGGFAELVAKQNSGVQNLENSMKLGGVIAEGSSVKQPMKYTTGGLMGSEGLVASMDSNGGMNINANGLSQQENMGKKLSPDMLMTSDLSKMTAGTAEDQAAMRESAQNKAMGGPNTPGMPGKGADSAATSAVRALEKRGTVIDPMMVKSVDSTENGGIMPTASNASGNSGSNKGTGTGTAGGTGSDKESDKLYGNKIDMLSKSLFAIAQKEKSGDITNASYALAALKTSFSRLPGNGGGSGGGSGSGSGKEDTKNITKASVPGSTAPVANVASNSGLTDEKLKSAPGVTVENEPEYYYSGEVIKKEDSIKGLNEKLSKGKSSKENLSPEAKSLYEKNEEATLIKEIEKEKEMLSKMKKKNAPLEIEANKKYDSEGHGLESLAENYRQNRIGQYMDSNIDEKEEERKRKEYIEESIARWSNSSTGITPKKSEKVSENNKNKAIIPKLNNILSPSNAPVSVASDIPVATTTLKPAPSFKPFPLKPRILQAGVEKDNIPQYKHGTVKVSSSSKEGMENLAKHLQAAAAIAGGMAKASGENRETGQTRPSV